MIGCDSVASSFKLFLEPLTATISAAGLGTIRQVADDDEDRQEREPCHPHQARVGDVSRTLRFDAGDGHNDGDDYCETEPS